MINKKFKKLLFNSFNYCKYIDFFDNSKKFSKKFTNFCKKTTEVGKSGFYRNRTGRVTHLVYWFRAYWKGSLSMVSL